MNTDDGYAKVWYGGAKRTFMVSQRIQEDTTETLGVRIEYDKVSGEFAAIDFDDSIAPTPGAKPPKRDALAVLVDAIAAYIAKTGRR